MLVEANKLTRGDIIEVLKERFIILRVEIKNNVRKFTVTSYRKDIFDVLTEQGEISSHFTNDLLNYRGTIFI